MTDQPIHSLTIALLEIKRVGPRTVEKLMPLMLKHYITTLKDAFELAKAYHVRLPEVGASERQAAEDTALRILETCHEQGTTYLHRWSREFPQALRNIPDAPVHLFIKGNSAIIGSSSIAVVGTRSPSDFSKQMAHTIALRLVQYGFCVVSGLAEGCDTHAHQGALDGNGPTVAVLAHGFGRIYPPSNQDLADRILAHDGCLVTEYVPGTLAKPSQFVARDRIQSGLSKATIVIETAVKGGTMHTAKFTTAQGRRLAALVPPAALSNIDAFQGNYRLLADGTAIPIHQPDDLAALIR